MRLSKLLPLLFLCVLPLSPAYADMFPCYVYNDGGAKENRFVPSGFSGDYEAIKMNERCKEDPQSGDSCIKFTYTAKPTQGLRWAGVFFQNPANNWGTTDGGYDLSGAKKLKFFVKGEKGGEIVEFKMGGVNGAYSDSANATTGPITLTKEWKEYEIPLKDEDVSYIFTGFVWVASAEQDPDGCTFFLDKIVYVNQ